jgi:hypothetical protein
MFFNFAQKRSRNSSVVVESVDVVGANATIFCNAGVTRDQGDQIG